MAVQAGALFESDAVDLPDSEGALTAVFNALPDEVAGVRRRPDGDDVAAEYEDGSGLYATLQPGGGIDLAVRR